MKTPRIFPDPSENKNDSRHRMISEAAEFMVCKNRDEPVPVSALFYISYFLFFCLEYLTLYTKFSRKQSIAPTYFGSLNILVATKVL